MKKLLCLSMLLASAFAFCEDKPAYYENPEYCAKCHEHFFHRAKEFGGEHHFYANRKILRAADFEAFGSEKSFEHTGKKYELSNDTSPEIKITENGESKTYKPEMAIGVSPLIQYLVEGKRGAFQVLDVSYDVIEKEWFNVFGDEDRKPGEWGHWQGRGMTWNSNCAFCHMTAFKKNYNPDDDSYDSKWRGQGISCLQCHSELDAKCEVPELPVRKKKLRDKHAAMENCAACHSRREQISADAFKAGDNYFDHFNPVLPDTRGVYFPDGQILEENFMYMSFMMCRQYDAGITCFDCHDAHAQKTFKPAADNSLCLSCHDKSARNLKGAPTIIPNEHSFHKNSEGNLCISCHMPQTTYMQRDARHDHGLISPDPYLTKNAGIPNACTNCHQKLGDKYGADIDLMLAEFNKRHTEPRFLRKRERAMAVHRAQQGEISRELLDTLMKLVREEENHAWRSALILLLTPYTMEENAHEFIKDNLEHESALVRSAAVRALSGIEDMEEMRADKSRLVRVYASFASDPKSLSAENAAELESYLRFNSDSALGALRYADYLTRKGESENALKMARHALNFESGNPELATQAAIMAFRAGKAAEALLMLKDAIAKHPKNAQLHYTLALLYTETSDYENAEKSMLDAVENQNDFARAWYNLSLIQKRLNKSAEARKSFEKASSLDASYKRYMNYFE